NEREKAAHALRLTAEDLAELAVIDEVIPEPAGGAHSDWEETAARLKEALGRHLGELRAVPTDELLRARMQKYLGMGQWRTGR
ncbi:MAG TPA: hypothetical protein VEW03_10830, partial [Longimicrobiaceae bacterium]|nr:hypothetical protein [Longimicrobiaceae bacterium]